MALAETVEGDLTEAHTHLPVARDTGVLTGRPYPAYKDTNAEWLGQMPAHWQVRRLSSLARILNGATPSSTNPSNWGGDVPWVTPTDLGTLEGRTLHRSARTLTDAGYRNCGASLAPDGSIALSTRAPIGHIGILGVPCCSNQGCRLLVPNDSIESDFFYYALVTFREELKALGQGSTFTELSRGHLAAFRIGLPPRAEQAAIVRFLDCVDGRIRQAIREKEKLVELLDEQRLVVIEQAVTGQRDVRTGKPFAAYKDSGVGWLPKVPAHWEMRRSKRLFRPRKELARPGDIQLSATQAYGVIAQEEYEAKIGRKVTKVTRNLKQRRHVEVDDFVISMRSFQGGLERAWQSGCIRSSYVVLQANAPLDVGYFGPLFKSRSYIGALQSTANFIRDGQDLNFENFADVDLPFPPPAEQREIAEAIGRETGQASPEIRVSHRQIALLREYRARLIADVVTGKVDVRETTVDLPEVAPRGTVSSGTAAPGSA